MHLHLGDCLAYMRTLPDGSADSMVVDPPYGLSAPPSIEVVLRAWLDGERYEHTGAGFMGAEWDSFVPGPDVWRECFRVLKPGSHALVFAGQRTIDLMGISLRLAGFEVRDLFGMQFYSGFPKNHDVSKAIDRAAGAEREVVGEYQRPDGGARVFAKSSAGIWSSDGEQNRDITAPATPDARKWSGFGTALKPCIEPAFLIRRPPEGTIAANVLKHGVGALNIDACRYPFGDPAWPGPQDKEAARSTGNAFRGQTYGDGVETPPAPAHPDGRWPSNCYVIPKVSTRERERGCDALPLVSAGELVDRVEGSPGADSPSAGAGRVSGGRRNSHPTLKSVRLLRWLCRLVTPPGGIVLDPFAGSGSCGVAASLEGFDYIGAELQDNFYAIASARIAHAQAWPGEWADTEPGSSRKTSTSDEPTPRELEEAGQVTLF